MFQVTSLENGFSSGHNIELGTTVTLEGYILYSQVIFRTVKGRLANMSSADSFQLPSILLYSTLSRPTC